MSRALYDLDVGLGASRPQRLDGADALLPGDHVVVAAVDEEGRGAVGAGEDLGVGGDGGGFGRGDGGGGGAVEEEGDGLGAPVHVEDEAPAGVGERHEHAWVVGVGGWVVVCELGKRRLVGNRVQRGGRGGLLWKGWRGDAYRLLLDAFKEVV